MCVCVCAYLLLVWSVRDVGRGCVVCGVRHACMQAAAAVRCVLEAMTAEEPETRPLPHATLAQLTAALHVTA